MCKNVAVTIHIIRVVKNVKKYVPFKKIGSYPSAAMAKRRSHC